MAHRVDEPTVKFLHGNLYQVRADMIQLVKKTNQENQYYNPRMVDHEPLGLDDESMRSLKESIVKDGLQQALSIRAFGENLGERKFDLLSGERRFRCIEALKKDNVSCYDPETKKFRPANEVYRFIPCVIHVNISEKQAFRIAMGANVYEPIGESAEVANVKNWLEWGWSEEEILETTGKSIVWVRETIRLTKLDSKTFTAFVKRIINRTVAIKLSEVEEVAKRQKMLEVAIDLGKKRSRMLITQKFEEVEEVSRKAEVKEAEYADAKALGSNNLEEKKEEMESSKAKLVVKKAELKEVQDKNKKPTVTIKDLNAAAMELNGQKIACSLTAAKIRKHWIEPLKDILKMGENEPHPFDLNDAKLLIEIFEKRIPNGEEDIFAILTEHWENNKNK